MSRKAELPSLSEAQLEILNVIWQHEACTVADRYNPPRPRVDRIARRGCGFALRPDEKKHHRKTGK